MSEIGGFLDIELRGTRTYHTRAIELNTCRNALRYYVRNMNIKKIYISYFTCDAVLIALKKENVDVKFYRIDMNLYPTDLPDKVNSETSILYTNYWGICDEQIDRLINKYGKSLIIDAAQAFYYIPPQDIVSINSVRKFFGVPDGAYLYGCDQIDELSVTHSYGSFNHLLKRFDIGAQSAYYDYLNAERHLDNLEIGRMSDLTKGLLCLVDYETVASTRRRNFNYLHEALSHFNSLPVDLISLNDNIPMVYPFKVKNSKLRNHLIGNSIYVATYWPNVLEWCSDSDNEFDLAKSVIPLPIDQRYGVEDMKTIILCIKEYYEKE